MRCLACNKALSDKEASRKYANTEEIKNPEDKFIGLCTPCLSTTDIQYEENVNANNDEIEDFYPEDEASSEDSSSSEYFN